MSQAQLIKRVFIVPYRDRKHQKFFFSRHMSFILEDKQDYEILFIHQNDTRPFNRGAMKNIGFITVKDKYPDSYKDINLIFHDIDTLPFHKIFDYTTEEGVIKHYYGFTTALGGIVVIKGSDFEKINGFPNYWGWGLEDANLQKRCENFKLKIDRSFFFALGSPEILHLFDGLKRIVSREEPTQYNAERIDGIVTINSLVYMKEKRSSNEEDNIYTFDNSNIWYVNVNNFNTLESYDKNTYHIYDLREPSSSITHKDNILPSSNNTQINSSEWKSIQPKQNKPMQNNSQPLYFSQNHSKIKHTLQSQSQSTLLPDQSYPLRSQRVIPIIATQPPAYPFTKSVTRRRLL